VSYVKTAEPIEMPLGGGFVGTSNRVFGGARIPTERSTFFGGVIIGHTQTSSQFMFSTLLAWGRSDAASGY